MRTAARWNVNLGANPGTNRRILLVSNTPVWPMSPSTSPDQNQSGATTGNSSDATCTSLDSTPWAKSSACVNVHSDVPSLTCGIARQYLSRLTASSFFLLYETFARSVGWYVGAVAYDKRRCHVDAREGWGPNVRKAEYDLRGLFGHLRDRNADGGEPWSGPPGYFQIIESDDGQLRGDCDPEGSRRLVYAECLDVGRGEDRRGRHGHGKQ